MNLPAAAPVAAVVAAAAATTAAAVVAFPLLGPGPAPLDLVILIGVVMFVTERHPLVCFWRDTRWTSTLTMACALPAVYFEPGTWIGPVTGIAVVAAHLSLGTRNPGALLTAGLVATGAAALGGGVVTLFGAGDYAGLAVGGLVAAVVRQGLLLLAARVGHDPNRPTGVDFALVLALHTAVNLAVGILTARLLTAAPWALPWLVVTVVVGLVAWWNLAWRIDQGLVLERTVAGYQRSHQNSVEGLVGVLLTTAADVCAPAQPTPGPPAAPPQAAVLSASHNQLYTLDPTSPVLQRDDGDVLAQDWVATALASTDRVLIGPDPDHPDRRRATVRIGFGSDTRVVLQLPKQPLGLAERIRVLRMLELISVWGERWLEQCTQQLSPDEIQLRDACARLTNLVGQPAPPVDAVLAELDTLSHLTATMLGSRHTDPDPDPGRDPAHDPAPPRRVRLGRFPPS